MHKLASNSNEMRDHVKGSRDFGRRQYLILTEHENAKKASNQIVCLRMRLAPKTTSLHGGLLNGLLAGISSNLNFLCTFRSISLKMQKLR